MIFEKAGSLNNYYTHVLQDYDLAKCHNHLVSSTRSRGLFLPYIVGVFVIIVNSRSLI